MYFYEVATSAQMDRMTLKIWWLLLLQNWLMFANRQTKLSIKVNLWPVFCYKSSFGFNFLLILWYILFVCSKHLTPAKFEFNCSLSRLR